MKTPKRSELECIAALSFNPFFKQEVERIRVEYRIPTEFDEALDWYDAYEKLFENKAAPIPGIKSPLDEEVTFLMARFGLPLTQYWRVQHHILGLNEVVLHPLIGDKLLVDIETYFDMDVVQLKVNLQGINIWTTKAHWEEAWQKQVKPEIDKLVRLYNEIGFTRRPGRKALSAPKLREEMKKLSEWYHSVEVKRTPIRKVAQEWDKNHPSKTKDIGIDPSTISKGVARFREIITPLDENDLKTYELLKIKKLTDILKI